ncbi:MAG: indolepyruvate ferredoxin oxidoreductase subunit alpha [Clostridiales bacterium]|nr:indolepyruvate ferredoxin oxidoreductase subunit alpha [Clostridiales bacterium]
MSKKLLTGNEAVARGFWEAGGMVVSAYPGTPSTEITENAAAYDELYAEWAPNEKVALEVALGAAVAGARSLAAMKHVGLNVAADPLFTASYTGINGGLVVAVADDPGMHSSQNEQDSRHYARAAKLPCLEPSDSAEARDFTKLALELSERFDTPVLLRLTTRISHGQSLVELAEREEKTLIPYEKDVQKYVMAPASARLRHVVVEQRMEELYAYAEETAINREEYRGKSLGVVCSGAVYQYVREALPDASVFKLGMVYPLPIQRLRAFAAGVDKLYVIEELDPFVEQQLKSWGIACTGKQEFPLIGEIFPTQIKAAVLGAAKQTPAETAGIPARPPVLCAGCPHRAAFAALKKLRLPVLGDIGCYTLAAFPPLSSMDTTVCMGASVSMAHGMEKASSDCKPLAVLGESTFIHSGITGLINAVYNQADITVLILDNSITAMTGHQQNPSSGLNARLLPAPRLDLPALAAACGVGYVREVDPFEQKDFLAALKGAVEFKGPAVVISKYPCVLLPQAPRKAALMVDENICIGCKACLAIGCPALGMRRKKAGIDISQCMGCALCASICPKRAIKGREEA